MVVCWFPDVYADHQPAAERNSGYAAIKDRPMAVNGQVEILPMMYWRCPTITV